MPGQGFPLKDYLRISEVHAVFHLAMEGLLKTGWSLRLTSRSSNMCYCPPNLRALWALPERISPLECSSKRLERYGLENSSLAMVTLPLLDPMSLHQDNCPTLGLPRLSTLVCTSPMCTIVASL